MADHEQAKPEAGQTVSAQGEKQVPKPRAPHEHDESADSQAAEAESIKRMGEKGHASVTSGQTDTDKGPVLDATYRKQK